MFQRKRKTSGTRLPVINIPTRLSVSTPEETFRPHNMWLTREMTEPAFPKKEKEPVLRRAYLVLDSLKTGDVFVSPGLIDWHIVHYILWNLQVEFFFVNLIIILVNGYIIHNQGRQEQKKQYNSWIWLEYDLYEKSNCLTRTHIVIDSF